MLRIEEPPNKKCHKKLVKNYRNGDKELNVNYKFGNEIRIEDDTETNLLDLSIVMPPLIPLSCIRYLLSLRLKQLFFFSTLSKAMFSH